MIRSAVKMRESGKSMQETAEWVEENRNHSVVFFSVDDLNYLKRGGRLSGGAAFFWNGPGFKAHPPYLGGRKA